MADKDDKDPPIKEQQFLAGVTVVDIGDYRVARGLSRRAFSSCPHKKLVYDAQERRIWCKDCEKDVEAFDAFQGIVENFSAQVKVLQRREQKVKEAEDHSLISVAAKVMDTAWRKLKRIPCCPHCRTGLMPEDFKHGIIHWTSKEFELARRRKKEEKPNSSC